MPLAAPKDYFEVVFTAGAGPHDFRKIRAVHPGVNGHLGPQGYTQLSQHLRVGPPRRQNQLSGMITTSPVLSSSISAFFSLPLRNRMSIARI